jgi:hypothetical protein
MPLASFLDLFHASKATAAGAAAGAAAASGAASEGTYREIPYLQVSKHGDSARLRCSASLWVHNTWRTEWQDARLVAWPIQINALTCCRVKCATHYHHDARLALYAVDHCAWYVLTSNGSGRGHPPLHHFQQLSITLTCWSLQHQQDNLRQQLPQLLPDVEEQLGWATEALGCPPDAVNVWIGDERSTTSFHKGGATANESSFSTLATVTA